MASINRKPKTITYEGGKAVRRTPKEELFLLCASFLNEDSFYETASDTRHRLDALADKVCEDTDWCLHLIEWLRGDGGLRTVAQLTAVSIVHASLNRKLNGGNRQLIRTSIQRPDEGPAVLAAWIGAYGRNIPKPVKRGVADALTGLTENGWLKWAGKTSKGQVSITDAIRLTHPTARDPRQNRLFDLIVNEHTDGERSRLLEGLPVIAARERFNRMPVEEKINILTGKYAVETIKSARLTHETIFSQLGKLDPEVASTIWMNLIPDMGYQALLMNVRRILTTCGEDSPAARLVTERVSHPEQAGYEPLPISFLSAYLNVPESVKPGLERAAKYSLRHVPTLAGRTLIMVDRSGSMSDRLSSHSSLSRYDAASMFACSLGLKNPNSVVIPFEDNPDTPIILEGEDPLAMLDRFGTAFGGTRVGTCTYEAYEKHGPFDRVIVITDEQTWGDIPDWWGETVQLKDAIPHEVPLYVWNLGGYEGALSLGDRSRVNLGGLSDASFRMFAFNESHRWPWEQ